MIETFNTLLLVTNPKQLFSLEENLMDYVTDQCSRIDKIGIVGAITFAGDI